MPTYSKESYSQPLDKVTFLWYIVTMTTQTTFEPCGQCGNEALLLEGNNGKCLTCVTLPPEGLTPSEKLSLSLVLEGCECGFCTTTKKKFKKVTFTA